MPSAAGSRPFLPLALLFTIGEMWGFFFVLIKTGVTGGVRIFPIKPDPSLGIRVLIGFGVPLMHGAAYVLLSEKHRPEGATSLFASAVMALIIALSVGQFQMLLPPFSKRELALILIGVALVTRRRGNSV